ncbi:MAG TPA: T9SS type A sorting domain-containing protein, partial [Chitinophagaceae bacterium]|nr:T9SS type A sorting domain-containing protein [Chitinophagaceae bacterium]
YSSENPNPVIGHNYYRLQQVDIDGHTSYVSQIVDLIWGQNGNTVSIYPNPASSTLNIDFYSEHILSTRIKLSDMSGRTIKQVLLQSNAGMNNVKVDLSELAAGLYTVQIFNDEILEHVEKIRKTN